MSSGSPISPETPYAGDAWTIRTALDLDDAIGDDKKSDGKAPKKPTKPTK